MQEVRRSKIAELVNEKGIVRIEELAKKFNISEVTIHRDLQYLENQGVLRKLRGGAIATPSEPEVQFSYRTQSCIEEKRQIGNATVQLIEEGDVIIMDGSTTCLEVAKRIKNMFNLTVFTNNPFIMYELMHSQGIVLYFIGGLFSRDLECFVGAEVEEYISHLHINKGVFGAITQ
ncbi:MAG: DeoR/GlpR family DNA-binding transcription regulator, partial [Actinobacteria bacterium]|nr:DeoR/GlpR family DNA-binding transcription regulator [Actinomycetota bacterium]